MDEHELLTLHNGKKEIYAMNRRSQVSFILCALLIIFATGIYRVCHDEFRRPFDIDELMTLKYYTWCGVYPNGEQRHLERLNDIHRLSKPGVREMALGLYCSLGRWPEPNNHLLNSFLMNFSLALGTPGEVTARLPALGGALACTLLMVYTLTTVFGWYRTTPLVAFWMLWCPYMMRYSQDGRGYSWMLALEMLLIISLIQVVKSPYSILWGINATLSAIVSFMNIVIMTIFIIVPAYVTFFFVPTQWMYMSRKNEMAHLLNARRKNLSVQLFCIGSVGFIFLMDRLPYIISSSRMYGYSFANAKEFLAILLNMLNYFFPSIGWKLFGMLGCAWIFFCPKQFSPHLFSVMAAAVFATALIYTILTRRFAYERCYGFILPFIMIGVADFLEQMLTGAARVWQRYGIELAAVAFTGAWLFPVALQPLEPSRYIELYRKVAAISFPKNLPSLSIVESGFKNVALYFPEALNNHNAIAPNQQIDIFVFLRNDPASGWKMALESGNGNMWDARRWASFPEVRVEDVFQVIRISGTTHNISDRVTPPSNALIFWKIRFEKVYVTPDRLFEHVNRYAVRYWEQRIRYQAKLDLYSRVDRLMFISESPAEFNRIITAINAGTPDFGEDAIIFIPDNNSLRSAKQPN